MMHRGAFFWGAVLILAGALLFLNNMGWLDVDVWKVLLPSIVILAGLMTLWGATRPKPPRTQQAVQVPMDGARRANVRVRFGAGRLSVEGGADAGQALVGTFRGGVEQAHRLSGESLGMDFSVPSDFFLQFVSPWTWWGGERLEWNMRVTETIPVSMDVESGASEVRMDLSRLQLDKLRLAAGASSIEMVMPASAVHTEARIESGAASLMLDIPEGVAARIEVEGGLADVRVNPSRFPKVGSIHQSPDYETAAHRLDLHIEAGAASVNVR
ncbi:MAG TPA: DUF5668 domain-containing protein [Anaerolineales bacterium]|nr:DUF5668 domain-containing protein [Anaerolineales bacterium]